MSIKIYIPELGDSISEAIIAKLHKKVSDKIEEDELIAEIETEKVNLEINSTGSGVMQNINYKIGDAVKVGDLLCEISNESVVNTQDVSNTQDVDNSKDMSSQDKKIHTNNSGANLDSNDVISKSGPLVSNLIKEHNLDANNIEGTGRNGRITAQNIKNVIDNQKKKSEKILTYNDQSKEHLLEKRVPMSLIRKTIAKRLKNVQNEAAILTTFNEIDMSNVICLRKKYQDKFKTKYNVKLGMTSFFIKSVVSALKNIKSFNASIDGEDIVFKKYYNIGIAVSTDKGLMVPVIKNADQLTFANIERKIIELSDKARNNTISMDDLSHGTFSITNGGIYGSLFSTPIINPPEVGILGLHNIKERAVVIDGKIEIRPMMYVALSYDHRIIDGKEAVTFLAYIKDSIENPDMILLEH